MSNPQKAMVVVLVVAVALFVVTLGLPGRSQEGDSASDPGGLTGLLGDWFGRTAAVDPADLSVSCQDEPDDLIEFAGTCRLAVASSETRLRTVRLQVVAGEVEVTSPPVERSDSATGDVRAGKDATVAVVRDGGVIGLDCQEPPPTRCTVLLLRED